MIYELNKNYNNGLPNKVDYGLSITLVFRSKYSKVNSGRSRPFQLHGTNRTGTWVRS